MDVNNDIELQHAYRTIYISRYGNLVYCDNKGHTRDTDLAILSHEEYISVSSDRLLIISMH